MKQRIAFNQMPKNYLDGLFKTGFQVHKSGLDRRLLELINYRVSQINGCAYCLDMHHKDAIQLGETEQRLHGLAAWRETNYYSAEERAALQFAESLTHCEVSDAVYQELEQHFNTEQIAWLALAVGTINTWNRLNITFRTEAGHYVPGMHEIAAS